MVPQFVHKAKTKSQQTSTYQNNSQRTQQMNTCNLNFRKIQYNFMLTQSKFRELRERIARNELMCYRNENTIYKYVMRKQYHNKSTQT